MCISCRRKRRENAGLLLNSTRNRVTMEKSKVSIAFFALVFTAKNCLQESQAVKTTGKVWSKENLPFVKEDQARKHLNRLDVHMSMGPDSMHAQVPSEMIDVILRPPLTIFQSRDTFEDWKKADSGLQEGQDGSGELQASQLHLDPQECDGTNNPGKHF